MIFEKKKLLIGCILGFISGIIMFFMTIGLTNIFIDNKIIYYTIGFPFISVEGFARATGFCSDWSCLYFNIFGGLIIYVLIGALISLIFMKRN